MANYTIDMIHTHYAKVTDKYSVYLEEDEIREFCKATDRNWDDIFDRQEAMRFLAQRFIENREVDYTDRHIERDREGDGKIIEDGIYQEDEEFVDNEAAIG